MCVRVCVRERERRNLLILKLSVRDDLMYYSAAIETYALVLVAYVHSAHRAVGLSYSSSDCMNACVRACVHVYVCACVCMYIPLCACCTLPVCMLLCPPHVFVTGA